MAGEFIPHAETIHATGQAAGYADAMTAVLETIGWMIDRPDASDRDIVVAVMDVAIAALILHDSDDIARVAGHA